MPVHLRLNDKDTSRNPYINFVTALPGPRHDQALHRLQQLAAMAKPLMKDQAFHINSLEEFEHNNQFAGRCWENGEVVELVLTNAKGSWIPLQYVLYVFCHELAHIKHMNHIPHLHGALTRHLKQLAITKQREGYYGDGLWSSGRQLQDGDSQTGLGMNAAQQDLPENVCGGAFRRARATRRSGKRSMGGKRFKGPSLHTGAQTASNTRGGNRRVKLDVAESSNGSRLDGKDWFPVASARSKEYKLDENSTFRKRTQSKDAREKRASAALARLSAFQGTSSSAIKSEVKQEIKQDEDDSVTEGEEDERESDGDAVSNTEDGDEDGWLVGNDLQGEHSSRIKQEIDEIHFTQADATETADQRRRRMQRFDDRHSVGVSNNDNNWTSLFDDEVDRGTKRSKGDFAEKEKRVKMEMQEMSDDEVILVNPPSKQSTPRLTTDISASHCTATRVEPHQVSAEWECLLCTLRNPLTIQRCAACDTSKGKTTLGA